MKPKDDQLDNPVQGYPCKSVCHGGLGSSTIMLLRGAEHVALVDVGTFNHRVNLLAGLQQHGLAPQQVTEVIPTHSHHDHAINWVLVDKATICLGAHEIEWAVHSPTIWTR